MRSMHIIFPKGQTIEGKEERGEEEAPTTAATATQHRTDTLVHPHSLTHGLTDTDTARPRPPFRSRRTCKIARPLARPRTTTHQQQEGAREDGPLFSASPSQGFFDVADADVKEGRKEPLAAPRERAMHEEVIPDAGDAGHFTIGTDREEQNVGKKFRESFGRGVSFPARSRDAISANSPNPTSR